MKTAKTSKSAPAKTAAERTVAIAATLPKYKYVVVNLKDVSYSNDRDPDGREGESLDALAASIKRHGVLSPVVLSDTDQGYKAVAGRRRIAAAVLAGLTTVPALVVDGDVSEIQAEAIALAENLARKQLTPYETARKVSDGALASLAASQVQDWGIGLSKAHINNLRRVWKDPGLRQRLAKGESLATLIREAAGGRQGKDDGKDDADAGKGGAIDTMALPEVNKRAEAIAKKLANAHGADNALMVLRTAIMMLEKEGADE